MAVINTNVKALFSQAALKSTERSQQVAMQQLSTGKRINSSRDDAAGMAIATRMTHQIRSLNQAVRNAGDAITLIQTAEGATNEITDMLQRMRELAIQASNDTNNNQQRSYLDLEFQQLKKQIVQISDNTEWNGFPVLNGSTGERVGIKPVYKTTSEPIGNSTLITTESPLMTDYAAATGGVTAKAVVSFKNLETGQSVTYNGITYTATTPNTAAEVAQNFANLSGNPPASGTKGTFTHGTVGDFTSGPADGANVTFTANSHFDATAVLPANPTGSGSGVVFPTVANTQGVAGGGIEKSSTSGSFIKSGNLSIVMTDATHVASAKFTLEDGQIIDITDGTSHTATGEITINKTTLDGKGLNLLKGASFVISQTDSTQTALDFTSGQKITMSVGRKFQDLEGTVAGDSIINNVSIGATQPGVDTLSYSNNIASAISKVAVINEKTPSTGVHAVVNPNIMTGAAMSGSDTTSGTITINGYVTPKIETLPNNPRESRALTVSAINFISAKTGVRAIDTFTENKGITLVADDGRNIEVAFNTASSDGDFSRLTGLKMGIQSSTYSLESSVEQPVNVTTATNGNIQRTGLAINNYNSQTLSTMTTSQREAVSPKYEVAFNDLAPTETVTVAGLQLTATTAMTKEDVAKAFASVAAGQTPSDPAHGTFTGALSMDYSSVAAISNKVTFTSTAPLATMQDIVVAGTTLPTVTNTGTSVTSLGISDLKINGVSIRSASVNDDKISDTQTASSSRLSSAIATVAAINDSSKLTGVKAVAIPATIEGNVTSTDLPTTDGPQSLFINGVNVVVNMVAAEAPSDRRKSVIDAVNSKAGFSGVEAVDNGNSGISLKAVDGRNVSVWYDLNNVTAGSFGLGVGTDTSNPPGVKGQPGADQEYTGANTVYGRVALQSDKPISVETGDNGFTKEGDFSFMGFKTGTFGGQVDEALSKMSPPRTGRLAFQVGANEGQRITIDLADFGKGGPITGEITWDADMDPLPAGSDIPAAQPGGPALQGKPLTRTFISSSAAAQDVLKKLDSAMDKVNQTRATMGAVMNRLDHVINNLTNVSMNLSASRSQIEDADYAAASTDMAKNQIMQQAATAVLAQANTSQQSVLKLLQG